jgi:hypothetical protein
MNVLVYNARMTRSLIMAAGKRIVLLARSVVADARDDALSRQSGSVQTELESSIK